MHSTAIPVDLGMWGGDNAAEGRCRLAVFYNDLVIWYLKSSSEDTILN